MGVSVVKGGHIHSHLQYIYSFGKVFSEKGPLFVEKWVNNRQKWDLLTLFLDGFKVIWDHSFGDEFLCDSYIEWYRNREIAKSGYAPRLIILGIANGMILGLMVLTVYFLRYEYS